MQSEWRKPQGPCLRRPSDFAPEARRAVDEEVARSFLPMTLKLCGVSRVMNTETVTSLTARARLIIDHETVVRNDGSRAEELVLLWRLQGAELVIEYWRLPRCT